MSCLMEEPSPSLYRHPQLPLDPSLPAGSQEFPELTHLFGLKLLLA